MNKKFLKESMWESAKDLLLMLAGASVVIAVLGVLLFIAFMIIEYGGIIGVVLSFLILMYSASVWEAYRGKRKEEASREAWKEIVKNWDEEQPKRDKKVMRLKDYE